ncbi:zinc finger protein OZF [Eurytemora carolleeae]|uniref:zinc finger protein OZF n=1 Tax=Eurytemora carolleeae TaxID=1294199 RepID=UPI000C794253|nr:zinc finger protein OZF [Eurytemora carolleeae]|eukprot:XP_023338214.1 zinc finger protein OZF-like [Eurytemora affinis]
MILAGEGSKSNWMNKVKSADSAGEANCLAISIQDELYFVTVRDLPPSTELTFYSREDPTVEFWTTWTEAWANQTRCIRCSIQFEDIADYRVHISVWHDTSFQGNPQNRIYFCPDCGAKRIGAKDIVKHCRIEHGNLAFPCRYCKRRFESYNSLIKHKKRLHAEQKPQFKCTECGKTYRDSKALKAHVDSIHYKVAELNCGHCEKMFSSKYALNRHIKEVHDRIVQHTCEECGKSFAQFSNLKIHWRTHTGLKPFICQHENPVCRVSFTTKQCLQVHYRKIHGYNDNTMPTIQSKSSDFPHHYRYHRQSQQCQQRKDQHGNYTKLNQ